MWGQLHAPFMRQTWGKPEDRRQWALERLADLTRRGRELEVMPAALRPISMRMMRRVIFAAYREAVATGAVIEAKQLVRPPAERRIA